MDAVHSPVAERAAGDLPLTGESVLCVSRGGRAASHAARLLADLGAEVVLAGESTPDEFERLVLSRPPAVTTVELEAAATLPRLDRLLAIVHEGELDPVLAAAAGDANRVALSWLGAGEKGSDAAAQAAGGPADVLGEPDREPLWFPHRMGEYIQGVNACAMVVLFALGERRGAVGELALADIWAYAAGTNGLLCTPKGIHYHREGRRSPGNGGVYPQRLYRAADGWIALLCRSRREWRGILEALDSPPWGEEERYQDILAMGVEYPDEVDPLVEAETSRLGRSELYARAIRLGFPLAPVRSPAEALEDEFLGRQSFWAETEGVRLPGPLWREESWIPDERPTAPPAARPLAPAPGATDLSGLRVLDLSWVWAGPMVGSSLADLGADVIKIENEGRIDNMRLRGKLPSRTPAAHRDIDPRETDPLFHNVNRGKRSVLLDLRSDEGRAVFLRLVAEADVVIEAFRPHVLDSWKLGFEQLAAVNPRIVLLSLRGLELDERYGPSGLRSYAPITSSLSGMESTIRYPDADGPTGAMAIGISDPVAGWHGTMLLLAALLRARRSGRGGWIRLSQLETLASVMPEMYFAAQRPDALPARLERALHCADGDVVVAAGAEEWEALAAATDLGEEGAATSLPVERVVELATAVGAEAWPVVGVDGHPDWPRRFGRPIMAAVEHRLVGTEDLYGHGWRLDGHQVLPTANAPVLGEHTREVLREYLGASEAEIDDLEAAGALR
jgi:crotonobetainyl-CoA:carnitine CoA-transferase CaiB-like acyl-CoA transferase